MIPRLVHKHEKKMYRFLEMLPGLFVWGFILSPLWLGAFAPTLIIFYITFLTVFWAFMAIKHSIGGIIGYKRYKKELGMDWMQECKNLNFDELPEKATLPKNLAIPSIPVSLKSPPWSKGPKNIK